MFEEYLLIAHELMKLNDDVAYWVIEEEGVDVNGCRWVSISEIEEFTHRRISDYGYCAAFTTRLEGKKPSLFRGRSLKAIALVKKNSLVKGN